MSAQPSHRTTGEGFGAPAASQITVALIPSVNDQLRQLVERTKMSKTDVINRAITLYEFVDAQVQTNREVLIRDKQTGEAQIVRIL